MKQNTQTKNAEPVEGFTGGDWEVGYGIQSNSLGIFTKKMLDEGLEESPICLISPVDKITAADKANAALIAASPKILTALEWLLDAIPPQDNDHDWWPDELTTAVANAKAILNRINNK